jgi:sialidase-1
MVNHRTLGPYRTVRTVDLDTGEVTEARPDKALPGPQCHAALCRYSFADEDGKSRILFSNPPHKPNPRNFQAPRRELTVRMSYDEGRTWPVSRKVEQGKSGYSDLTVDPRGTIFCLYETGKKAYNESLAVARFDLEWLTQSDR